MNKILSQVFLCRRTLLPDDDIRHGLTKEEEETPITAGDLNRGYIRQRKPVVFKKKKKGRKKMEVIRRRPSKLTFPGALHNCIHNS